MIRRLLHTLIRDGQPIPASGNVVVRQSDTNNPPSFEGIILKPKENGPIIEKKRYTYTFYVFVCRRDCSLRVL